MKVSSDADKLRQQGIDVVDFGAGEPDFPTPDNIKEAAIRAIHANFTKYTPAGGLPELKEAVAAKTERDSGYVMKPAQVLITNGGKQAVEQTFATLLDPGDEVLLLAPYWTTYPEAIRLAGGVPVEVPTTWEAGFRVRVDELEAARTARTKILLFVSPSNPTGAVYPPELVAEIGRWAAEHGLWVVTDEIYEHLVYGDARFATIATAVPELADRCVVLNGVAKTYAMTGWRVGWMIGPKDVIKAAANYQSHATSNVANVSQMAALAAVTQGRIAEAGTHSELLAAGGTYAALWDAFTGEQLGKLAGAVGGQQFLKAAQCLAVDDDLGEGDHAGALRKLGATVRIPCQIDLLVLDLALGQEHLGAAAEGARVGGVKGDWLHCFTKDSAG